MLENITEPNRPQMTIQRVRVACWITKATDTHSEYLIVIASPLQQWLRERAPVFRYTYIACLVGVNVSYNYFLLFPISLFFSKNAGQYPGLLP